MTVTRPLFGRMEILTDAETVTSANVVEVLKDALPNFEKNRDEIQFLYDVWRGKQGILQRTKSYNTEVINKIVENHAHEIVAFKTGYLVGEPIQYINASGNDDLSDDIQMLNAYMSAEDKETHDSDLTEWVYIAGVGYRGIFPDKENEIDEAPFELYTLDPRETFVVKHNGMGHKPVMSVQVSTNKKNERRFFVYTPTHFYEIFNEKIVSSTAHLMGYIPVIEYSFNKAKLGIFELVLPMLDAMNEVSSNRDDAIENFVQAFLVFMGADIEDEAFQRLKSEGALMLPPDTDVKYLVQELNQMQTQTLVDYMYQTVLRIVGMPVMGDGTTSDSSNNGAVILRNGWTLAEARAKEDEKRFKKSEKQFLKIALRICSKYNRFNLKIFDIEAHFTRRNYENVLEKAQILTMLLSNDKVHPRLAFESCGLFIDPEAAYLMSDKYRQEQEQKQLDALKEADNAEIDDTADDTTDEANEGAA